MAADSADEKKPVRGLPARSRIFGVGPLSVVIESDHHDVVTGLERLFSGFADAETDVPAVVRVSAADDEPTTGPPHRFRATFQDRYVCRAADRHTLALAVTRTLNRAVLDAESSLLHLHAGAVTRDGQTVLVIGTSFAGKSTLVAKLVATGWSYLTDEQLAVTVDGRVVPFQRPVTLRENSWSFFEGLDVPADPASSTDRIEVAPDLLGSVYHGEPILPTIVVRPDVSIEETTQQSLTVAQTIELMVRDSLDLERAGTAGVRAMLQVAQHASGYALTGTDLDDTCRVIEKLCARATQPGAVTDFVLVSAEERSERVAGSQGWLFADGSSALYEPVGGAFVRLDEHGFATWQLLGADPDTWPTGLRESDFVSDLLAAGLLKCRIDMSEST